MSIKEWYKRHKSLVKLRSDISKAYFSLLTIISPKLNTKAQYMKAFGKRINLSHPETLSEKILWLKLNRYMNDPLVIQCADKFRVREYVEQCDCGNILNELFGVYDSADDILWDELPDCFVLKWNFGSGLNIICTDKSSMSWEEIKRQLRKWQKIKYWLPYSEMQYKYIPKKIVCEKYLLDAQISESIIPDYKVYCFHGKPLAILVMYDRGHNIKAEFFDENWNELEPPNNEYERVKERTKSPRCLQEMLEISQCLSQPFPFVRCDYYVVNHKLYFGELTFTPFGGLRLSTTKICGKDMSEYLLIP